MNYLLKSSVCIFCSALFGCVNNPTNEIKPTHVVAPKHIKPEIIKIKNYRATPEETALCEKQGGHIEQQGMAQYDICVVQYADADKTCQDSSDCMGDCVITEMPKQKLFSKNQSITGKCSTFNTPFGCYGLVQKGKTDGIMCVD